MKKSILPALILFAAVSGNAQKTYPTIGKIISYDNSFAKLVSADAKIEVLASNIIWAEGPVWVKDGGYLLFSDAPRNTIFKWDGREKVELTEFIKPSGYTGLGQYSDEPGSNGLTINHDGELVACEHGDRRVTKMNLKLGGKVALADKWQGKRLNSPNDICQHSNGTYFFTDPPYGLPGRDKDTANRELKENGVYCIFPDGTVKQIISNLVKPNGIALSPDEKLLYISQSDGKEPYIMAYLLKKDGTVGDGKVFFDFSKHKEQLGSASSDGIKPDADGNMYAAAANGVVVISPQGKLLGKIETGVPTSNCAFGQDNYLYITAEHYVCRIKVTAKIK
jgi:gluconolactonase